MPRSILLICATGLLLLGISSGAAGASSVSIPFLPSLYVSDYGAGVSHPINSYNLSSNQGVSDGAWMLLGTNDQTTFAMIDARKGVHFNAAMTEQFNVTNSNSYRWYYLYLQDGFHVGSSLDFHLNELSPAPIPTPHDPEPIDIVIERAPLVVIIDFNGRATRVDTYNLTSSVSLPAGQSWQLLGTNDPALLGSDDPGLFTLLDNRSGIGFTGGVPEKFTVTGPGRYLYYVLYLQSGFSVTGMNLRIDLSETPTRPSGGGGGQPTPVPTPTPLVPPAADFEGNPRAGTVPLMVTFLDTSTGQTSGWSWDFGDGQTSPWQSPVHTYTSPGIYTVNFTTCNEAGCSWVTKAAYIYAIPTATSTPTTTPRYYIKIGEVTTGTTSAGEGTQATEGSAGTGSGTGPGSSGSGGGKGSHGTGNPGGPGGVVPQQGQPQTVPAAIISAIIEAMGGIVTMAGDLIEYLQGHFGFLLGW
jgi:hypothetical protein